MEFDQLKRRQFITLLGGAAVAWPLAARAQKPTPVVGFLGSESAAKSADLLRFFHQGLGELGFVEGQNLAVEYRWADGHNDRLPALAADLVRRGLTVLVAGGGTPTAMAAKAATATIPVVFAVAIDPVKSGLVASMIRPGGNLTGITNLGAEVGPKRLEVLREMLPRATAMAVLVNPTNPALAAQYLKDLQPVADKLGVQLHVLNASADRDLDAAFESLARLQASGLVIMPDVFFTTRSEQLAALALHHAVPAIYEYRPFTAAG